MPLPRGFHVRRLGRVLLTVAAVIAVAGVPLVAAAPASADTGPAGDAFYIPPNPLPAGSPGDVIWWRGSASPVGSARAWQVLYRSTTAAGTATAVSGTVLVPTAPFAGTRPVVAYAAGTQGWGDQCAPSKSIASNSFDEQFAVTNLLNRGWAVAVTDYPGLGTPGDETYNVGIPEGFAVLDSLRAATRLAPAALSPAAPMAIEGYSQGGAAAGWAAQQLPSYAPELRLAGIAAGGTPANLQAVARNINGTPFFAFLAGTAIGFNAAYPAAVALQSRLTPVGKAAVATLNGLCQLPALALFAGQRIENFTVGGVNPITVPAIAAVLNQNNLGTSRPTVPILQYHGLFDEVIPYSVENTLHNQWCAVGTRTQLRGYLAEHVLTQVVAQTDVTNYLSARLAGTPAPSNC
ncbi:MAG TPA: lipase family protein [Mycobacteriales bacterium]|nr:lipase family protein [Mycobacteriales bacterium]